MSMPRARILYFGSPDGISSIHYHVPERLAEIIDASRSDLEDLPKGDAIIVSEPYLTTEFLSRLHEIIDSSQNVLAFWRKSSESEKRACIEKFVDGQYEINMPNSERSDFYEKLGLREYI